ncbi:ABC transporter ATP-binding protein [Gemmata sp. G18]|uniref:ABC transporter ATP-binding protein n=1 Tax=Gemmata palustris TaxID=2822762 RepID=A0ABS5BV86_9BACT|nr:ABC transporter ATP-binding protein [Gemmata palustris]MBP3957342.1 ABC transporter ATP-binding protein [Gemmata palustris]
MIPLSRYLGRLFRGEADGGGLSLVQDAPAVICRREPALAGVDLFRSFGSGETRSYALKGVSADFQPGELNLLMGPSGSGKSTLLAVLSGLLRPDTGTVGALGRDVWRMGEDEMERFRLRHCSYIFQGYNLFPALTAREQLEIVLKWGEGCPAREARCRADRVLGQLGLSKKAHLRPAEMSGGEKQRVAIGRALVKNPSFVFADEPTSALDWENGEQVINLLTETARENGAMVLVVTHDPRLTPFADRVFELADGQLQSETEIETESFEAEACVSGLPSAYEHTPLRNNSLRVRLYDPQE